MANDELQEGMERGDAAKDVFYKVMAHEFHSAYERLAPDFGYETRPDTKEFEPESHNGQLMIAVTREVVEPHIRRLQTRVESAETRLTEAREINRYALATIRTMENHVFEDSDFGLLMAQAVEKLEAADALAKLEADDQKED